MKRFKRILKNESGQGMLEYVLLLAIVAALVATFHKQIVGIFDQATQQLGSKTTQVFSDTP